MTSKTFIFNGFRNMQKGGFVLTKEGEAFFSSKEIGMRGDKLLDLPDFGDFATKFILDNSRLEIFSTSSLYGFIFKATLNEDLPVVFSQFFPSEHCENPKDINEKCYRPVREFIIKFSFLSPDATGEVAYHYGNVGGKPNKNTNKVSDFVKECETQYKIYNSNFLAGCPIVPPILNKNPVILGFEEHQETLKLFSEAADENFSRSVEELIGLNITQAGIMIMALAEGFVTLSDVVKMTDLDNDSKIQAINLARFFVWKFSQIYGLIHKDMHMGNILINTTDQFVLKETEGENEDWQSGNVYLIDFGRNESLIPEQIAEFDEFEPTQLFEYIQERSSIDSMPPGEVWPSYKWLTDMPPPLSQTPDQINSEIKNFDRLYNNAGTFRSNFLTAAGIDPVGTLQEVHSQLHRVYLSQQNYRNLGLTPPRTSIDVNNGGGRKVRRKRVSRRHRLRRKLTRRRK
jgi:hypothetical protein